MPSNHLILCCPLLLLPSIFSSIRVFSNESALRIRWPKYWSFSFNISPTSEHPGLDILQNGLVGFPCSPRDSQESSPTPQFKSIISSALSFLQLSHPYLTTGKNITLTRWTFVGKVMSLLFNMLSMLVITFLPRSKGLLVSWLQSSSAVILEHLKMAGAQKVQTGQLARVLNIDSHFQAVQDCSRKPLNSHSKQRKCVCTKPLQLNPTLCSLSSSRLLSSWDSVGKNTGVGCHVLLQGIFLDPETEPASPVSPAVAGKFFTTNAMWQAQ